MQSPTIPPIVAVNIYNDSINYIYITICSLNLFVVQHSCSVSIVLICQFCAFFSLSCHLQYLCLSF